MPWSSGPTGRSEAAGSGVSAGGTLTSSRPLDKLRQRCLVRWRGHPDPRRFGGGAPDDVADFDGSGGTRLDGRVEDGPRLTGVTGLSVPWLERGAPGARAAR